MDFELRAEERGYLEEVRAIIRRESTPELLAETRAMGEIYGGTEGRGIIKKIGAKGLLTSNWPKEYGGLDTSDFAAYAIRDELAYAGLPWIFVGASVAGPTILRFGGDELKRKWLPPIARGECEFALRYTEPQAGSDLSSISMKAEEKWDHFVLNGQKIFSTAVLGATAILDAGTPAQKSGLLPKIASGEKIVTLAWTEMGGIFADGDIALEAKRAGDGYVLSGTKLFVPDASVADHILCACRAGGDGGKREEGIGPEDIDIAEVQDGDAFSEIEYYEELGFCPRGEGGRLIDEGVTELGGRLPVNTSGGLQAKGEPLGASHYGQIFEIVKQLRGEAEKRQVPGPRIGLAQVFGAYGHCGVTILERVN